MQRILSFLLLTIFSIFINAQSAYMHEAAEEALEDGDSPISGFIALAIIFGIAGIWDKIKQGNNNKE